MTFPLWAYAGGGALLVGALAGWTVRDWKADCDLLEAENKHHEQFVADAKALAEQSLAYEALVQSIRASERTDRETIREIYRDKVVPAECAVPADAVSLLDNAVLDANAATTGQSRSPVPETP